MEQKIDPQSTESKTTAQNTENNNEVVNNEETMEKNNPVATAHKNGAAVKPIEGGLVNLQTENDSAYKEDEKVQRRVITDIKPLIDSFSEKAKNVKWAHPGARRMSWEYYLTQYEGGVDEPEFKVIKTKLELFDYEKSINLATETAPGVNYSFKSSVPEVGSLATDGVTEQEKAEKDYTPVYTDEEKDKLIKSTAICEEEIARVKDDPLYAAIAYGDGENVIINLTQFKRNGGVLGTPIVNRTHGKDEIKTGNNLMSFGPQHILLATTKPMADDAGLESGRFANDTTKGALPDTSLIIIDGNGRINHLHSIPLDKWPNIYAVFPTKDAAGYYNIPRAFDVINTEVSVWKTQDMVQKKLIYGAGKAHEGWKLINMLVNKGYKYQAACELATLTTDRIKKETISNGSDEHTFIHFKSAKTIYNVLRQKFGEDDTTLKTKAFPMKVSELWGKLQKQSGDDAATDEFVKFIKGLSNDKVTSIKGAKSKKGGATRDILRQTILEQEFLTFINTEGIELA